MIVHLKFNFQKKIIGLLLCIAISSTEVLAQQFQFTDNCQKAYKAYMSMRNAEGRAYLLKELRVNKNNFMPIVLFNYDDFISLTFNEDPKEYKLRKPQFDKRLKLIESADANSPYYLFSKGLLYFQWSAIQIKYADYWNAAWDFRRAFLIFKENKKKYPDFAYNNIFIGAQEAVISTIPNGYKWISKIFGMKGNMKNGMGLLYSFIRSKQPYFNEEAFLYFIYLKNYLENDVEGAYSLIKDNHLDTKNNQLFAFMEANLSLNNKNAKNAETVLLNRNTSNDYIPFPMLDYEMGDAKLRKLDYSAVQYYERFIKKFKREFLSKRCML
ncbi:MAG: Tetratricopeptide TPR_1 repeat-containing protein [Bacteroidetes bacterium OLB11]|nr:MAG: Tetratricopeptide TPR_1 repeat-containing protein [Bacteroidetes bacterium OLB11]